MKRIEHPGHARFLTFSCYQRLPLFSNDAIKQVFVDQLAITRARHDFHLYAWVLMPEHAHMIVRCHTDATVTMIMKSLKTGVAKRTIGRWRELNAGILIRITDPAGKPRFWQRGGGYDRNLIQGNELQHKFEYLHANPVRRGLTTRPEDWPWSSARWWSGQRDGELPCDDPY
jgi:putative transposase